MVKIDVESSLCVFLILWFSILQMTARQAERRLEDSRQEAAQLRNRLTYVEKNNADPNASQ